MEKIYIIVNEDGSDADEQIYHSESEAFRMRERPTQSIYEFEFRAEFTGYRGDGTWKRIAKQER